MSIHLGTDIGELRGMGEAAVRDCRRLGIVSVCDLLWHVPYRYEDFTLTKPISRLSHGHLVTLTGRIVQISSRPSKNRRVQLTEALFENETGGLKVTWFNQTYLERLLRPGMEVALAGRIDRRFGTTTLLNPVHEPPGVNLQTGRIIPVYALSGSLTQRRLHTAIEASKQAFEELIDWLPEKIKQEELFFDLPIALKTLHFPESQNEISAAHARLVFDELFLQQLLFAEVRKQRVTCQAQIISIDIEVLKTFVAGLPFRLTNAQRKVSWKIMQDLSKEVPMNRLLQGDVGSGKTIVAALAAKAVSVAGFQTVYLAPTEMLAIQQHRSFCRFFPSEKIGLLTRTNCLIGEKEVSHEVMLKTLASGRVQMVIGTHALLQKDVQFAKLSFVIIDEQHRFGVRQRHALFEREGVSVPHLLSMTATPIPRSLALTLYGDLDISVLDESPEGRLPITTRLIVPGKEKEMERVLVQELNAGSQAYIVCPFIDPSDIEGRESVQEVAERLKKGCLKDHRIGLLHGRLSSSERDQVLEAFIKGSLDVVIATTVIEVGMDVPNATVMVILGAECFGLAQLHQLRGRVGRSDKSSYCFLCPKTISEKIQERLQTVVSCQNGFVLAERDLELRGSGNFFGQAQSGFPDFRFASMYDVFAMKKARDWVRKFQEQDPEYTQYPSVRERILEVFEDV